MQEERELNGVRLTEEQLRDLQQMMASPAFSIYERVLLSTETRKLKAVREIPSGDIDLFRFLQTRMMGGLDAYDEIKYIKPLVTELLNEIRSETKNSSE